MLISCENNEEWLEALWRLASFIFSYDKLNLVNSSYFSLFLQNFGGKHAFLCQMDKKQPLF